MRVALHRLVTTVLSLGVLSPLATTWAQAPNDNCGTPSQITGNGPFAFDFSQATFDTPIIQQCGSGPVDGSRDLWYCWTASCTGQMTVTTCNQTTADTIIAIYPGCLCPQAPAHPSCCNDDTNDPVCGVQSTVTCDVQCGQQYMIQIAEKNFGGLPPEAGTFSIECAGSPCGQPTDCPDGNCCGRVPRFTNLTGPVSAFTYLNLAPTGNQLQMVDLANSGSAPAGSNWGAAPFVTPHASWSRTNLGTVFGVAIDGPGNVYVAHTSVYGHGGGVFSPMPFVDALGAGGAGAIYKIASATGVATPWITLPNTQDPIIAAQPGYANEAWPGIGNISTDCVRNTLFASNFDDGRIYRISLASGTVLSAYDHASNTVTAGGAAEAGDAPGFVRLGERIWAVEPHNGRVYYSIWGSDVARTTIPNTVWSIQCDPITGEFLPSTRQLEVLNGMTPAQNHMPCSDISFTPSGTMLIVQRSMGDFNSLVADTLSWAHDSYMLEFECDAAGGWNVSANNFSVSTNGASTAGGVDVDFRPSQTYSNYATADALVFSPPVYVYGVQGLSAAGGTVNTSLMIDSDQDTSSHDKTAQGSIEISCPLACAEVETEQILCVDDTDSTGNPCYTYTFTVTNQTAQTVQYIMIPAANVTPNIFGPFAPGTFDPGDSQTLTVTICGQPLSTFSFPLILMNTQFEECCNLNVEIQLPDCDCFQLIGNPTVVGLGGGQYSITFTWQPIDYAIGHLFFAWEPPIAPTYTVSQPQTYFPVSVPQWGTATFSTTFTVNTGGGQLPANLCFRMLIHMPNLERCCSKLICFNLMGNGSTCPGDVNGDGVVDLLDLSQLLSSFGMGSGATHANGDLDGDGDVDIGDLTILLSNFGQQC